MADTKISDLPTDIVTLADGDKFPVADASALSADTYATALEIKNYINSDFSLIRAATDYVLAVSTSSQVLFPSPNALTLPVGTYTCRGMLSFSSLSGTSGNALLTIIGAGTAVTSVPMLSVMGIDGGGTVATQTGSWQTSLSTGAAMVTATASNSLWVRVEAVFNVTTSGTLIPSITLLNASTGNQLNGGSYLSFYRFSSSTSTANIGSWT